MEELKPCPFCGGKAVYDGTAWVRVICKNCGVSTPMCYGGRYDLAANIWNRRVDNEN